MNENQQHCIKSAIELALYKSFQSGVKKETTFFEFRDTVLPDLIGLIKEIAEIETKSK